MIRLFSEWIGGLKILSSARLESSGHRLTQLLMPVDEHTTRAQTHHRCHRQVVHFNTFLKRQARSISPAASDGQTVGLGICNPTVMTGLLPDKTRQDMSSIDVGLVQD